MENDETTAATWQARATLWELLAFSLRYPSEELPEVVSNGEWESAAREVAKVLGIALPDEFAAEPGRAELHTLRAEATRLFIGSPDPVVSPFEGVWAAADDGVQPLLFVNPKSMEVERFCRECGLGQPEGTNEPLDHIATECELLQYLSMLAAGTTESINDDTSLENLPGGSPEAAYATFLTDHARTWMPRFADAVKDATHESFYRNVAMLLKAALA